MSGTPEGHLFAQDREYYERLFYDMQRDREKNMAIAKFCPNCGRELNQAQKFCPNCGHSITSSITPSTPVTSTTNPALGKTLSGCGIAVFIIGGIIGTLYSLYIVSVLYDLGTAVIAFFILPITYTILPWYIGFKYGGWGLWLVIYGSGITGGILNYYGEKLSGKQ